MYLKSLELTGFKSFAEAKIQFPAGITGVVGPNGTGKSNVVDAILWVLGEQSTKTLRSERMEDVIFNGTETRKPLGMVEVSLVISGLGEERIVGIPALSNPLGEYHEVMITRRLYRNGDSEYLINKTHCRLKDIRSLLLDTRAGIKGHTIIEQGRIDQVLNASPKDRRELIEETAGIVRYKKQKAEALRKLEATQQNLLRVRDVVSEVRRQLNSLERQARQARTYKRLQDEAKVLEIRLLVREARALLERRTEVEGELRELEAEEAARAAQEGRLTSELQKVRRRMHEAQDSLGRIREELTQLEQQQAQAVTAAEVERSRLDLYEQQRLQASEDLQRARVEEEKQVQSIEELRSRLAENEIEAGRAAQALQELEQNEQSLAERRSAMAAEENQAREDILQSAVKVTQRENQVGQCEARREELADLIDRLSTEETELIRQGDDASERLRIAARTCAEAERQLQRLRQKRDRKASDVSELEEQLAGAREEAGQRQAALAAAESRLRALEAMVREEMGYGRVGDEEATSLRSCQGIREALAEWLIVPDGLERAIEAILGERGRAWLVEDPNQTRGAIDLLKQKELGRGSFIPVRPRRSGQATVRPKALGKARGIVGWASELVSARDKSSEILHCLFDGVLVVESLEAALSLWESGSCSDAKLVTLAGEIVDESGIVTGGEVESSGGLIQRQHEVQRLTVQRIELTQAVEASRQAREQAAAQCESARADVARFEEDIRASELQILALKKDQEGFGGKAKELTERLEAISGERTITEAERARLQADLDAERQALTTLVQEKMGREAGLSELAASRSVIEQQNIDFLGQLTEARLNVSTLSARREHDEADLARLLNEQEEQKGRIGVLEEQLAGLVTSKQQSEVELDRNERLALQFGQQADVIRGRYVSAQEDLAQNQERSGQLERSLDGVRKTLTASRESRTAVEVRRAEVKTQLLTLEGTLSGTYQLSLTTALEGQEANEKSESGAETETRSEGEVVAVLREQLQAVRGRLERMGPINLAAIEEHQALEDRHTFLTTQEQDLSESIKSLKEIIQRINRTTEKMFVDTFNELQQKFGEVFARFFPGGRAELILTQPQQEQEQEQEGQGEHDKQDNQEKIDAEPGVDIVAQPPGKRLKNISMLSGGEKTLTAMALIFASFLIRPTPFCVLDEIDAPLDEENIGRFTDVLRELSVQAQFIVITHNKRTMAVVDSLFGVTMEDPGVSQLLSIRLGDLQPA